MSGKLSRQELERRLAAVRGRFTGVLGRLLLEYWWPGDWAADGVGMKSPYFDAVLA